jgi:hypothetical protein
MPAVTTFGAGSTSAVDRVELHADQRVQFRTALGECHMTDKPTIPTDTKKKSDVSHPGMMGDGTEEQNLDERGDPAARIEEDELDAAFGNQKPKK